MCPFYKLVAVSQPLVIEPGCLTASPEATMMKAYSPLPKGGGYCLSLPTSTPPGPAPGTVYWGGFKPIWVFGPKKVWFS